MGNLSLYKTPQLRQPSARSVYIDEGRLTPDFYMTHYTEEQWIDQPGVRHNEGVTISFADGHADHWKWQDSRTKKICRMEWDEFVANRASPDNKGPKPRLGARNERTETWKRK